VKTKGPTGLVIDESP